MTSGEAAREIGNGRQTIQDIFANWHGLEIPAVAMNVLAQALALLAPMRSATRPEPQVARQLLANAQISVDTETPGRLRLTIDPFAGKPFHEVRKDELSAVLDAPSCAQLMERALRLYRPGHALPQTFWLGVAPFGAGCVVKAYISNPDPVLRQRLAHIARDAGWLPPELQRAFLDFYERLAPSIGTLEGIGISYLGSTWLGTTFYLRSSLPWGGITSALLAALLDLSPTESLGSLGEVFPHDPAAVGWSIECDDRGALVDLKLEIVINGCYSAERAVTYARRMGLDIRPFAQLARTIETAGLCLGHCAVPKVLSLRFVQGSLRGMVAYYPLAIHVGDPR